MGGDEGGAEVLTSALPAGFPESGWQQQLSPEDLPRHSEAQSLARIRPGVGWLYLRLGTDVGDLHNDLDQSPVGISCRVPATYREPLCPSEVLPRPGRCQHRLGGRYPAVVARIGSCAEPNASHRLWPWPRRWVFAGCCEPLLADGPSRRYLHDLCLGAWTPTPPRSPGALPVSSRKTSASR